MQTQGLKWTETISNRIHFFMYKRYLDKSLLDGEYIDMNVINSICIVSKNNI